MRKLGMIGGTSWHSSAVYYRLLNEGVARAKGGLANAPLILENLDFAAVLRLDEAGKDAAIIDAALRLEKAGAQGLLLASNTMHRAVDKVAQATSLDILDIRGITARRLVADGMTRIALLGTRTTMTEEFASRPYREAGLKLLPICQPKIDEVHRIIFEELVQGRVVRDSQRALKTMLSEFARARIDAVVLGCTELAMAIDPRANILPVYDTTALHAAAAVEWLLADEELLLTDKAKLAVA